ncbi:hypothetical protein [Marinicella litoralis]|uniref:Protocatechuate 3,4-dioxygenase beta subunit n=1 Tax=Marinicella litoralis TaxID=644220 RepID=A0A4R6XMS5_9GAMM|nr:hypothetical protein [Marinicella litoralis]TDR17408.1 protocatechuate 3,4-dioxygenase beta subunit [Marinicella litoralis]
MNRSHFIIILHSLLFLAYMQNATAQEPVIGGPCQGCELVFIDMPKELKSHSRITPAGEEGEPLILEGIVYNESGKPASGMIIYAYQTDAEGLYPTGKTNHGQLRGWAITDTNGLYRFDSVRPGAYPRRDIPQHIHLHVIEPNKGTYYIDDVTFDDDPLLLQENRNNKACRAGCGVSLPKRNQQGIWHVKRDIYLGKNITDY